jgi:dTMP kinase
MATTEEYPWKEPAKPVPRGAFIIVEGLDRAGKTTQVKKLCDALYASGRNVKSLRFPGELESSVNSRCYCLKGSCFGSYAKQMHPDRTSPIGKMIGSYLQSKTEMDDHAIHLLFSANRWEKAYAFLSSPLPKPPSQL